MSTNLIFILGLSIFIPVLVALFRWKKIGKAYYPFLLLLVIWLVNEIISYLLIKQKQSNAINCNIGYLVESLLITYQFNRWQLFNKNGNLYYFLMVSFVGAWLAETFLFESIRHFASHFIIFHSFAITLLSINMLNRLIASEKKGLLRNAIFLICVGFILFFTYSVVVETFYLFGLSASKSFQKAVTAILYAINFMTNLLYAYAVIWIPKKSRLMFTSSSW